MRRKLPFLSAADELELRDLRVFESELREIPCYEGRDGLCRDCAAHHPHAQQVRGTCEHEDPQLTREGQRGQGSSH